MKLHPFFALTALTLATIAAPASAAPTVADIHPDTVWTDSIHKQFGPRHEAAPRPAAGTPVGHSV